MDLDIDASDGWAWYASWLGLYVLAWGNMAVVIRLGIMRRFLGGSNCVHSLGLRY